MKKNMWRICLIALCIMGQMCIKSNSLAKTYKMGFSYQPLSLSIKKRIQGSSFPVNATGISFADLRYVKVKYVNFKGKTKVGELIVNKKIASRVVKIFYELYQKKYPIQRMKLIDEYGAKDEDSMTDNNTSAFNYRKIAGSNRLSYHSRGLAIDINPRINPCVKGNSVSPVVGTVYVNRNRKTCKGKYKMHMIKKNDILYRILKKYGFAWGGDWKSLKDYQHFEYPLS